MIVIAGTSAIIAAADRNARESATCRQVLQEAVRPLSPHKWFRLLPEDL